MKKKPVNQRDWHEVRIETVREKERVADRKSLSPGGQPSGAVGLTGEPRPGLGARTDGTAPGTKTPRAKNAKGAKRADTKGKPRATKRGYEEPRPAPREQAPDSLAHEQERQTGMSGQSSGT